MKEIQSVIFMVFFGVSIGVNAERAILFQDKTITIYTDNTVVYADGSVPVLSRQALGWRKITLLSRKNIVKWTQFIRIS